jgi:hypothetical protein
MTREKAQAKADALAKAGTPTRVRRAPRASGGYTTENITKARERGQRSQTKYTRTARGRATEERYRRSPKWKATSKSYAGSPAGRAAHFRGRTKRRAGHTVRVTAADIARLREQQGNVCPLTGIPLDQIKTPNVDHDWSDVANGAEALRGIIHPRVNPALGRTDADLFDFHQRLGAYAGKRYRLRLRRACATAPRKKLSKRKLAALRTAVRKAGS